MKSHSPPEDYVYNPDHLEEIIHQVPVDYYQNGVANNFFQRMWHTRKLSQVVSAIRKYSPKPKKILDVGVASGWFLSEVIREFPQAQGYGVDVYKEAIDYGKDKYKNLQLSVSDAHVLPFKDKTFDVIISCEVLEHVVNPDKVVKEMKRVLTNDGIVIIEIDSGSFLFKIVWHWWTNMRKGVWRDSHIHPFNIHMLEDLFTKNNLVIEKKKIFNWTMAVIFVLRRKD
jgi:ubiquinone/menaquinone biosynthesis C-methylase UbiE